MFYVNRETVDLMRALKSHYGDRMAQTNSRRNGNYAVVRLYNDANDRGNPKLAIAQLETVRDLRDAVAEIATA